MNCFPLKRIFRILHECFRQSKEIIQTLGKDSSRVTPKGGYRISVGTPLRSLRELSRIVDRLCCVGAEYAVDPPNGDGRLPRLDDLHLAKCSPIQTLLPAGGDAGASWLSHERSHVARLSGITVLWPSGREAPCRWTLLSRPIGSPRRLSCTPYSRSCGPAARPFLPL